MIDSNNSVNSHDADKKDAVAGYINASENDERSGSRNKLIRSCMLEKDGIQKRMLNTVASDETFKPNNG